ncbi:lysophospholipid acyltransferase family protein [Alicycliphilus denitrificans]|jgi:KDO2-lipid IV(A) lauroyltransferase|uniref:Lysophospholipid acyltransferase family protein n=1 Tax=Alicycliphilus denitrificans TaxID=179636 RepID=A0A420KEX2_9BURK|nr:lysophospholipid acyltransferase family protein [Alicycliphilus denitrificans]MBN9574906.1 lysophospholipid acyltransferase family protein [Alicycliphilus denitrificans]OJW84427.1 MAG: lipid A biosynthesis acyltransferase [Alicycliphilus sp. 69-12]RKJ98494.1 lysophospholipid acyltransferase family protein [Alicycliphilus denitrificans]HRO80095.1 lysophospholipid acyltransferase family protein [Alicycliphilus denitrificans]
MPSIFRLLSALPLWLLHAIGALLGWVAFCASPTYRRRFLANAARAGYRLRDVRAAVAHAGRMVAEAPRLWLAPEPPPCEVRNAECVQRAWEQGRGIVFLTPHIGCFEMSVQEGARRWSQEHGPFTILYRPARQPWLARVMQTVRNRPGIAAVPTTLQGVRQMLKALRAGRAVGLLPDQVPPQGQGLWSPFFGQPAYTMTLAARLVQQTGAAVILARCERLPRGRGYVLHLQALEQPLAPTLDAAVLQINQAMEQLIRQSPGQYLWGYARYKQPRAEAQQPESGA